MLWLIWRQHRWQLITVAACAALYCCYLIVVGVLIRDSSGACAAQAGGSVACLPGPPAGDGAVEAAGDNMINTVRQVMIFGNLLPLAAGAFWGAPLIARELEEGTYRLAFTQSVSRRRWLATKLGLFAATAALVGLGIGGTATWTQHGFAGTATREPFGDVSMFSQSGFVPAAAWVFALVVGTTVGLLLRRSLAAAGVTIVLLAATFAGLAALRPHYLPPVDRVLDAAHMVSEPAAGNTAQGWLYRVSYVDPSGRGLNSRGAGAVCADPSNTYPTAECLRRTGLRQRVVYQPAGRYPLFQLIEMGLLGAASILLALLVERRLSRDVIP